MFEIMTGFMEQLVPMIVPMIGIYICFDWIGTLLFGRR